MINFQFYDSYLVNMENIFTGNALRYNDITDGLHIHNKLHGAVLKNTAKQVKQLLADN